jgi:Proteasome non-ATPase 26S subunit.
MVIPALKYLNVLADHPKIIRRMIEIGMVTIVSSFVIHDPRQISPEILTAAGHLLLRLEDEPLARAQMLKSNLFFTILPLVTFNNKAVRQFWYDAMADLCNHKEFRAQLELEPSYLNFLKKALDEPDMEKGEELSFAYRVLFQSKFLLGFFTDEVTMPKLFDFYKNFMREATKEYVIYVLESLELIAQNREGRENILKNLTMLEVLVLCIQREDESVANIAGRLLLFLLENSKSKLSLYQDLTCR